VLAHGRDGPLGMRGICGVAEKKHRGRGSVILAASTTSDCTAYAPAAERKNARAARSR
jgi:hypothetical protein